MKRFAGVALAFGFVFGLGFVCGQSRPSHDPVPFDFSAPVAVIEPTPASSQMGRVHSLTPLAYSFGSGPRHEFKPLPLTGVWTIQFGRGYTVFAVVSE